jgi:hypothetical protein
MARDGSGTYNLPAGQPVETGTIIDSTVFNTLTADMAAALTASLAKDGQTTPTANLPMGTFRHTGVGDGSARTQYASIGQLQDGAIWTVGSVSGTNTITGSLAPAITAYVAGMYVTFEPAGANTGAATIALNGLAAKAIVKFDGAALVANDLQTGNPATLVYDGVRFFLMNPQSGALPALPTGSAPAPSVHFAADTDTGMYLDAVGQIAWGVGGARKMALDANQLFMVSGNATNPSYSFLSDVDTGMYLDTVGQLGWSVGGQRRMAIDLNQVFLGDGSAATPSFSFFSDSNTGIYRISAGNLGFTEAGTGYFVGYRNIPQNSQNANYTAVATDAGKHILHISSAGAGNTFTIPANASVAYAAGTTLTFINRSSNAVSIAITSDTLVLAGTTTTGTRSLGQNGVATAVKVEATTWVISGAGLS